MTAGQPWLFPPPKPLVERLGGDFFARCRSGRAFISCEARLEDVSYVGNLRKWLSDYRVANVSKPATEHRVTKAGGWRVFLDCLGRLRKEAGPSERRELGMAKCESG
ncbi:MAG: hypothetical protein WBN22_05165 [Verrucomicrobiia bacterium]